MGLHVFRPRILLSLSNQCHWSAVRGICDAMMLTPEGVLFINLASTLFRHAILDHARGAQKSIFLSCALHDWLAAARVAGFYDVFVLACIGIDVLSVLALTKYGPCGVCGCCWVCWLASFPRSNIQINSEWKWRTWYSATKGLINVTSRVLFLTHTIGV